MDEIKKTEKKLYLKTRRTEDFSDYVIQKLGKVAKLELDEHNLDHDQVRVFTFQIYNSIIF